MSILVAILFFAPLSYQFPLLRRFERDFWVVESASVMITSLARYYAETGLYNVQPPAKNLLKSLRGFLRDYISHQNT